MAQTSKTTAGRASAAPAGETAPAPAHQAVARKTSTAKRSTAQASAATKESAAKKAPTAKKAPAAKASTARAAAPKATAENSTQERAAATEAAPATTAATAPSTSEGSGATPATVMTRARVPGPVSAESLPVRAGETRWTAAELEDVRAELLAEETRLRGEITSAEQDFAAMLRDAGEGAGDDQADAGSKTFEREHEMSLANNARDMLEQVTHALHNIDDGTYGACEGCGEAVGKARLQAFPRATLCMTCKQREERR